MHNTKMENTFKKGEYLEVETSNNGMFGGYFFSQNNEKTRLSLFNVRHLPKGEITELIHFSTTDIKYVQRDTNPTNEIKNLTSKMEVLKFAKEDSQSMDSIATKFIFINQADNRYYEAIGDLKKNSHIGLGSEGAELGRKCKLSILTMSTPLQIYIFDVQALQESGFECEIKQLLECSDITKITHNSRKISDCLFHKHGIKVNKVFDTQAADIIIQKQKNGSFPPEVRSLQDCLNIYLGLKEHTITDKIDIVELAKRPVIGKFKEIASNNILYLHHLYGAINRQIMAPFIKGFDFYVNCERMCSDSEAWYLFSQDKKLPKSFHEAVDYY